MRLRRELTGGVVDDIATTNKRIAKGGQGKVIEHLLEHRPYLSFENYLSKAAEEVHPVTKEARRKGLEKLAKRLGIRLLQMAPWVAGGLGYLAEGTAEAFDAEPVGEKSDRVPGSKFTKKEQAKDKARAESKATRKVRQNRESKQRPKSIADLRRLAE